MQRRAAIAWVLLVLVCCIGADQLTKTWAHDHLRGRATLAYLDGTVRLEYAENPGAFLSLGATLPARWRTAAFTIGAAGIVGAMFAYALRDLAGGARRIVALSLICAGGVSNLVDRIHHHGYVVDFLSVGIGTLRTGIFNLADVALMTGIAWLVLFQGAASATGRSRQRSR